MSYGYLRLLGIPLGALLVLVMHFVPITDPKIRKSIVVVAAFTVAGIIALVAGRRN
jgi:hypothetical protein